MNWQNMLYVLPGILLGLTVHECCHALCAWKLGDNTARDQGRITLNPLKHIDIVGFIFLLVVGFGWAKPVEFSPENLKNFRRDRALIAAAGPISNFVLGVILALIVKAVSLYFTAGDARPGEFIIVLVNVIYFAAYINFVLFIFNLIPIPPLDGSHIVFSALNLNPQAENVIRKIGMPILLIVLLVQNFMKINILPLGNMVNAILDFIL
jgi:Zn-dependent protease